MQKMQYQNSKESAVSWMTVNKYHRH